MAQRKRARPSRDGASIQIRFQVAGRQYTETLPWRPSEANLRKAERYAEGWRDRVRFGAADDVPRRRIATFAEIAQEYLNGCGLALSTRNSYRDALNVHWLPGIGHLDVATIPYRTLREIDRAQTWGSEKTRKNSITALRQVFAYAMEEDLRSDNPAAQFRVRKTQKPGPAPYTPEDRARILDWLDREAPPEPCLFGHIAFGTGMRTGEIIALETGDVRERGFDVVRSRVRGQLKSTKTEETRFVRIDPGLRRRISAHLLQQPKREARTILLNQYGRHYQKAPKLIIWIERASEALGIRHRKGPYPWRHTWASHALRAGAEPSWCARHLGHSLETFFREYAAWITSDRDQAQADLVFRSWRNLETGGPSEDSEGAGS